MNTEVELLETLKELRSLYVAGDLREYDFDVKISSVESELTKFEAWAEEQAHTESLRFEANYVPNKEI